MKDIGSSLQRDDTITKVRRSVLGFGEMAMRQTEG
jgi:hypothetical protein